MDYTIVMPIYNKEEHVYNAVQSALKQTLPPASVLIVDDASTDLSLQQLEPFSQDKRVRIIQMQTNVGISQVLNEALKRISTTYFIQLDADDWLEPHAAEYLIREMEKSPQAAFGFGNHRLWEYSTTQPPAKAGEVKQPRFQNKYDFLLKLGYMVNPRCYRTSMVKSIGGWIADDPNDPWKGRYLEDARMILRLAEKHEWIQVEEFLHNVVINRTSSKQKIPMYNHLRKTFYEQMLSRWGNHYVPVWATAATGRLVLVELRPNPLK